MRTVRIGVDTGGTFTDFVISENGRLSTKKIPSTPDNPSRAILEGLREYLDSGHALLVIHGTTVATNALLERKGPRIALVTTKGYEDILSIGRQTRRLLYSLKGEDRIPLVRRNLCFGVSERTTPAGTVERAVSPAELRALVAKLRRRSIKAVAVSFINAYAGGTNEETVADELERRGYLVCASSRLLPEYREFERTSTTAVNAYLMPILDWYLESLEAGMGGAALRIMQSNEGYISSQKAKKEPIRTALSGPAGGVVGSLELARAAGFPRFISFDMGGTSTDVSLVDGEIRRTNESAVGDFPIRLPIIDIHSVGAGGGSIAHLDEGGSLRVGPRSAGADPGPACYGRGELPTVTDANLVLGRIDPDFFLGGRMKILPERSREAVGRLAARIGKTTLETAQGIIDIANANMEKAIRVISIERGFDPREFVLLSFGGAGGMHAADLASALRMKAVLAPENAGVLSAFGLLLADSIKDYSRSILKTTDQADPTEIERRFKEMEKRGRRDLAEDGFKSPAMFFERSIDLRYLGQSYEITVPFRPDDFPSLPDEFHRVHEKTYAYRHARGTVEIVTIRVKARGVTGKLHIRKTKTPRGASVRDALRKIQPMYYGGRKYRGPVYDRSKLSPGLRFSGPALVMDFGSTTFLPPGFSLRVDGYRNLIIRKNA
ncbi:MAG: hydantoinase/oxoprolinase family protein [Candidatus Aminicenantes bacterium]|nr:hydantoinase/oxoprolinase family protein [Candidatus Aminicenantes bacterium]